MSKQIKVSVRNLVEFVLRSGDIDNTFMGSTRAVEGTRAHQKVQNSYGEEYTPEVVLKHILNYEDFTIEIEGRADGILKTDENIIIDEIKSTVRPLDEIIEDYNPLHWAQGKCYGYMYAIEKGIEELKIQLTYFNIELVERSRDMFSAQIVKEPFLKYKRLFKEDFPNISKAFNNCNKAMNKIKREHISNGDPYYQKEEITDIYPPINKLIKELEEWLIDEKEHQLHEEILELYFELLRFIKIADFYDNRYVTYIEQEDKDVLLKLFCIDPSYLLSETLEKSKAAILFSATLTPLDYYRDILGGDEEDYIIRFNSPFPKDNLCLLVGDTISTKYKDRDKTYLEIVEYIEEFISQKRGNYFVFFPSYKYMEQIYTHFIDRNPDIITIIQDNFMKEEDRENFLNRFHMEKQDTMVAFAVLGGIFSEGIDLIGDKLIGAVIVGVGLPQICFERNIIREYFQSENGLGYEYAYMYLGMNKVLQAAGRVIRSEEDKGAILLIDERFATIKYRRLYPKEWSHYKRVGDSKWIRTNLRDFWKD